MANSFSSPGVNFIEKDLSQYAPSVDSSIVGLVGFASKGPTNEATLITSPQDLVRIFGEANENITGQLLEGAIEILETTNQMYIVRAADSAAADASATVGFGSCPQISVSGGSYGVDGGANLYLKIQVTNSDGTNLFTTPKGYAIPAGTVTGSQTQTDALRKVIGGSLDSAKVSVHGEVEGANDYTASSFIVGSYPGRNAILSVSAYSDATFLAGVSALHAVDVTLGTPIITTDYSALTIYGSTISQDDTSGIKYVATTKYPGSGYNAGGKTDGSTSGNSLEIDSLGDENFTMTLNDQGVGLESYKVAIVSGNFFEDTIGNDVDNTPSEIFVGQVYVSGAPATVNSVSPWQAGIVQGSVADWTNAGLSSVTTVYNTATEIAITASNPRFVKMIPGTYNFAGGDNGIPTSSDDKDTALIGDTTVTPKTGMQALDDPLLNISLAAVPGITTENVQNALLTLAETTQEFLAVIAPPYAIGSVQDAVDWHNGQGTGRTSAINNSYGAIMWPWVKSFSPGDGKSVWMDPSIYGIRQMAYTDNVGETWNAPAGFRRGRLTKPTDVEVKLNQGDRDTLYSGGNVINPITNFAQQGITIFGQRTATRISSSLDRINVRRLMIFVRKVVLKVGQPYVFQPNDLYTWVEIEERLNPLMDDILRRRGITEFNVRCDETTNTAARVDRNELWTEISIKPTKSAEIITFQVNLVSQSSDL